MKGFRRVLYFLLLNVLVSALTVWAVVTIMLRNQPAPIAPPPTLASQADEMPEVIVVTQPAASSGLDQAPAEDPTPEDLEIAGVIGAGELDIERITIRHIGESEVSLLGWSIQDEDGYLYRFQSFTMFRGGEVSVYTGPGVSSVQQMYWGLEEPVWHSGERAFLVNPEGIVHAVYTVP